MREIADRLSDLDWVDPATADLLRAKIDAMTELFGYPVSN